MDDTTLPIKKISRINFDRLAFGLLLVLVFLLPFFSVPLDGSTPEFWKMPIIIVSSISLFLFWLFERLRSGIIILPQSPFFFLVFAVPVIALVSSAFSASSRNSFFGSGIDPDASVFILFLFIILLVVFLLSRDESRVNMFYKSFLSGSFVLLAYQSLYLTIGDRVNFFGFVTPIDNLLGKWSDVGVLSGLVLIILLSLKPSSTKPIASLFRVILIFLSIFFSSIALSSIMWLFIGLVALSVFYRAYFIERNEINGGKDLNFSGEFVFPMAMVVLAVLFVITGGSLRQEINTRLHIPLVHEIAPSFVDTFAVAKGTFSQGLLRTAIGAGPNRFSIQWEAHRPVSSLQTIPLQMGFMYGSGFLTTTLVTVGVVGFVVWVLFILIFMTVVGYAVFSNKTAFSGGLENGNTIIFPAWAGASFLWFSAFIGSPGSVLLVMSFAFTGVACSHVMRVRYFTFAREHNRGFFTTVALLFFIGGIAALFYSYTNIYRSLFAYRNGMIARSARDIDRTEANLISATRMTPNDVLYRSLSQAYLARLVSILDRNDMRPDDFRIAFQSSFEHALTSAKSSTEIDPENFRNWIAIGDVFAVVAPLKISGLEQSYEMAKNSYMKGLSRNPLAQDMYLILARLDLAIGKRETAKELIGKALAINPNSSDAFMLLAGIQEGDGQTKDAVKTLQAALAGEPNNIIILFKLGFLQYQNQEYDAAISAFEMADKIQPSYANAKYFLGLSYYKKNRDYDALHQFKEVLALNPGNPEVSKIIANIEDGRDPFE